MASMTFLVFNTRLRTKASTRESLSVPCDRHAIPRGTGLALLLSRLSSSGCSKPHVWTTSRRRSRVSPSSALPRREARTNTTTLSKPSRARPPRPVGVVGARTSARGALWRFALRKKEIYFLDTKNTFFAYFLAPETLLCWAFARARARERERESRFEATTTFRRHIFGESSRKTKKHLRGCCRGGKDARARQTPKPL